MKAEIKANTIPPWEDYKAPWEEGYANQEVKGMRNIYEDEKEDDDLETLMWELEQLNEQNPKGNSQSWDL